MIITFPFPPGLAYTKINSILNELKTTHTAQVYWRNGAGSKTTSLKSIKYRKPPNISPGLMFVRKHF